MFVCVKFSGIFNINNSTVSSNETLGTNGSGGGVFLGVTPNFQTVLTSHFRNVTITKNTSNRGGGIATPDFVAPLSDLIARVANTIVSDNKTLAGANNNIHGRMDIPHFKHNLIGSGSQVLDRDGVLVLQDSPLVNLIPAANNNQLFNDAPGLAPLADYGGPTPTHALQPGSLAIDRGSNDLAKDPLTDVAFPWDQRGEGFARSVNHPSVSTAFGPVDIGAYELTYAPKVANVTLKSSTANQTLHPPVSFNGPDDSKDRDGTGRQLETVSLAAIDIVEITFTTPMQVVASSLMFLYGLRDGAMPVLASGGYTFTPGTAVATWRYNAPLSSNQYLLQLMDSVFDVYGIYLDG
ncbi:MAG: hypothetical protein KF847_20895, partial [Pirellulales bacterium]|nr:hypothetical protein [Pirellulales bacterium]